MDLEELALRMHGTYHSDSAHDSCDDNISDFDGLYYDNQPSPEPLEASSLVLCEPFELVSTKNKLKPLATPTVKVNSLAKTSKSVKSKQKRDVKKLKCLKTSTLVKSSNMVTEKNKKGAAQKCEKSQNPVKIPGCDTASSPKIPAWSTLSKTPISSIPRTEVDAKHTNFQVSHTFNLNNDVDFPSLSNMDNSDSFIKPACLDNCTINDTMPTVNSDAYKNNIEFLNKSFQYSDYFLDIDVTDRSNLECASVLHGNLSTGNVELNKYPESYSVDLPKKNTLFKMELQHVAPINKLESETAECTLIKPKRKRNRPRLKKKQALKISHENTQNVEACNSNSSKLLSALSTKNILEPLNVTKKLADHRYENGFIEISQIQKQNNQDMISCDHYNITLENRLESNAIPKFQCIKPKLSNKQKQEIRITDEKVRQARSQHFLSSIHNLYKPQKDVNIPHKEMMKDGPGSNHYNNVEPNNPSISLSNLDPHTDFMSFMKRSSLHSDFNHAKTHKENFPFNKDTKKILPPDSMFHANHNKDITLNVGGSKVNNPHIQMKDFSANRCIKPLLSISIPKNIKKKAKMKSGKRSVQIQTEPNRKYLRSMQTQTMKIENLERGMVNMSLALPPMDTCFGSKFSNEQNVEKVSRGMQTELDYIELQSTETQTVDYQDESILPLKLSFFEILGWVSVAIALGTLIIRRF